MKTSKSSPVKSTSVALTCHGCTMPYGDYKQLLEHLYWRHGTESFWCKMCGLKRWGFAIHICHVLPIKNEDGGNESDDSQYYSERESDYCFCGKYIADAQMIGCDGPHCVYQWYHFECVGIQTPPEGEWLCSECIKLQKSQKRGGHTT
ncbi:uncharacterized protein LOC119189874 [Manduca sexta]|uniref:uncharacterized protein LOC119189874 n=1 Tax=Manduca sexta TaxID=7130 RepID=UPI00189090C3|nr:uncharacterized protein LOC119189874 [Manduca sexta]